MPSMQHVTSYIENTNIVKKHETLQKDVIENNRHDRKK